jgi:hypothetical protein
LYHVDTLRLQYSMLEAQHARKAPRTTLRSSSGATIRARRQNEYANARRLRVFSEPLREREKKACGLQGKSGGCVTIEQQGGSLQRLIQLCRR